MSSAKATRCFATDLLIVLMDQMKKTVKTTSVQLNTGNVQTTYVLKGLLFVTELVIVGARDLMKSAANNLTALLGIGNVTMVSASKKSMFVTYLPSPIVLMGQTNPTVTRVQQATGDVQMRIFASRLNKSVMVTKHKGLIVQMEQMKKTVNSTLALKTFGNVQTTTFAFPCPGSVMVGIIAMIILMK